MAPCFLNEEPTIHSSGRDGVSFYIYRCYGRTSAFHLRAEEGNFARTGSVLNCRVLLKSSHFLFQNSMILPYKKKDSLFFCLIMLSYTNHLTYWLTPWCRVLLEQLTGLQLVKKFPAFHGTRMFITALTSVRHLSHLPPFFSAICIVLYQKP